MKIDDRSTKKPLQDMANLNPGEAFPRVISEALLRRFARFDEAESLEPLESAARKALARVEELKLPQDEVVIVWLYDGKTGQNHMHVMIRPPHSAPHPLFDPNALIKGEVERFFYDAHGQRRTFH